MSFVSLTPALPQTPRSQVELLRWAGQIQQSVQKLYIDLAKRTETMISYGTLAKRPTAAGLGRFYFATDTKQLFFDDGSWQVLFIEIIATASLPVAGATQNGRVVIENAAVGDQNIVFYSAGERHRIDGGANI